MAVLTVAPAGDGAVVPHPAGVEVPGADGDEKSGSVVLSVVSDVVRGVVPIPSADGVVVPGFRFLGSRLVAGRVRSGGLATARGQGGRHERDCQEQGRDPHRSNASVAVAGHMSLLNGFLGTSHCELFDGRYLCKARRGRWRRGYLSGGNPDQQPFWVPASWTFRKGRRARIQPRRRQTTRESVFTRSHALEE